MYKLFYMILSAVLILILFISGGCVRKISSVEESQLSQYKVNNPDASYFDVPARTEFLKTSNDPIFLYAKTHLSAKTYKVDCETYPNPTPVDYYLSMPAFYDNRSGWRKANLPLERFERYITRLAELYVQTADHTYAKCLAEVLYEWAARDSLLSFDYNGNKKQAWYGVGWATASAGMAYSIIRNNSLIPPDKKEKIEIWLKKVAKKQISYPGGSTSCCNNHSYWRGLEAVIVGVVTREDSLFRFGIKKYISALHSMNKDGSFPLEMRRGKRSLKYQNFAILPLVYIAEIAIRQGYQLYDIKIDGKDLHLAIDFLMQCINDIKIIEKKTGSKQDRSFIYTRDQLNWMEPYLRRFKHKGVGEVLVKRRPIDDRWSGGSSTLYFYHPENK